MVSRKQNYTFMYNPISLFHLHLYPEHPAEPPNDDDLLLLYYLP